MAGSNADQTTGLTVVGGTSAFACVLTSFDHSGITRDPIETTDLSSGTITSTKFGNRTFIPSDLVDPGEISISGYQSTLMSAAKGPEIMHTAAETFTVTLPKTTGDSTAATVAFSGFWTSYQYTGELNGAMTFTATIKVSGNVTVTDAA